MRYSFQLVPHANIRYREALQKLALNEFKLVMQSFGIDCEPEIRLIGGCPFLCVTLSALSPDMLYALSHSPSLYLMALQEDEYTLKPLLPANVFYLPSDLPEVMKYKGKTSVSFTLQMMQCARSIAQLWHTPEKDICLMDPMCGRGTTLQCALMYGMQSIGLDAYAPAIAEADQYLTRYLKLHHLKHARKQASKTIQGKGVPEIRLSTADTKEHYLEGDTRSVTLYTADASLAGTLTGPGKVDLLICDLPYGVQHDPTQHGRPEKIETMLSRCLPSWYRSMKKGGAGALSMNLFTLKRETLIHLLSDAGFTPIPLDPDSFVHDVEQAVRRDLVLFQKS